MHLYQYIFKTSLYNLNSNNRFLFKYPVGYTIFPNAVRERSRESQLNNPNLYHLMSSFVNSVFDIAHEESHLK